MKNILVPTDFSICAGQALEVAVELAKRFGSNIYLYHHLDLPAEWRNMNMVQRKQEPDYLVQVNQVELQMDKVLEQFSDTEVSFIIDSEPFLKSITNGVQENGIDLIVMGSHGTSGKNEFFVGSNTQKVVRAVHCPVLVIKKPLKQVDFKKVVYASSFNESDKDAFLKFKKFIKHFLSEIHLVLIRSTTLFNTPKVLQEEALKDYAALCQPLTCHTHIFKDFTIERGIRVFAEKLEADLIVIANHNRHPLKRMLVGSNVEALINHADLPVLSIDYDNHS